MGNLVETLKRNIDAVAVTAACLAVLLGSQAVCPRSVAPSVALRNAIHLAAGNLCGSIRQIQLPRLRCR